MLQSSTEAKKEGQQLLNCGNSFLNKLLRNALKSQDYYHYDPLCRPSGHQTILLQKLELNLPKNLPLEF
jgi:hypothetical protein